MRGQIILRSGTFSKIFNPFPNFQHDRDFVYIVRYLAICKKAGYLLRQSSRNELEVVVTFTIGTNLWKNEDLLKTKFVNFLVLLSTNPNFKGNIFLYSEEYHTILEI